MSEIANELEAKSERRSLKRADPIRSSDSGQKSAAEIQSGSNTLSKDLSLSLMGLISEVNRDGVTPETVNASCNAANAIYKILRLNFEMKKEGF